MTKMPREFKYERQIWYIGSMCLLSVAMYLVLIGTTVYNTLQRQRSERQISQITSELSEMEFSYLNLKAKINPELARSLGFVEVHEVLVAKGTASPTAFVENINADL